MREMGEGRGGGREGKGREEGKEEFRVGNWGSEGQVREKVWETEERVVLWGEISEGCGDSVTDFLCGN
jgi:hypothetical protein